MSSVSLVIMGILHQFYLIFRPFFGGSDDIGIYSRLVSVLSRLFVHLFVRLPTSNVSEVTALVATSAVIEDGIRTHTSRRTDYLNLHLGFSYFAYLDI